MAYGSVRRNTEDSVFFTRGQAFFIQEVIRTSLVKATGIPIDRVHGIALEFWADLPQEEKWSWVCKAAAEQGAAAHGAAPQGAGPQGPALPNAAAQGAALPGAASYECLASSVPNMRGRADSGVQLPYSEPLNGYAQNAYSTKVGYGMDHPTPSAGTAQLPEFPSAASIYPNWDTMGKKKRKRAKVNELSKLEVDVTSFLGTNGKPLFVHHATPLVCEWKGIEGPDEDTAQILDDLWTCLIDKHKARFQRGCEKMTGHKIIKPGMLLDRTRTTLESKEFFCIILEVIAEYSCGNMGGLQEAYDNQLNTAAKRQQRMETKAERKAARVEKKQQQKLLRKHS